MPYTKFDRDKLLVRKLAERENRVDITKDNIPVTREPETLSEYADELIINTVRKIIHAREHKKPVVLAFGAHMIKNGMSPTLIALMEDGWVTHLATNGAGIIHDWEFAYLGRSSEDVKANVEKGQFGIWDETGYFINLALIVGSYEGLGYGESVGKMISQQGLTIPGLTNLEEEAKKFIRSNPEHASACIDLAGVIAKFSLKPGLLSIPHTFKKFSVQARAYELGIPFTGHPMIGHDIIYNHPMNHGAAIGRTALSDFLTFAGTISNIENGVYISVGSAVMSPMIFEKSLSMAQNIMIQKNKHIDNHYMLIVDLAKSEWDWQKKGEPPSDNPAYYLRYCKTFARMGGEMHYLSADNRDFLLTLYQQLNKQ
jgi:hypothetical protein